MVCNIVLNLLILGYYKYFNFFIDSFASAFTLFGGEFRPSSLSIILPVGISFYTFQALSYTIDVYRGDIKATRDPIHFFAYVSFFPQLVAGPIERATNLLPQFAKPRTFDYAKAVDGSRQILWGLFKKMVIADRCAECVNIIFEQYQSVDNSMILIVGAVLYTIQIYGDFSGYSDIAIGTAKLFGVDLMQNFNYPNFSRDMAEFWRRWHISLSTWFRNYIYIPLGGSRGGKFKTVRNTFIIFLISGFWHGANWTFIVWGLYHALLIMPLILFGTNRRNRGVVAQGRLLPSFKEVLQMGLTFALVVFSRIIYRAETLSDAWGYIYEIATSSFKYPGGRVTFDYIPYQKYLAVAIPLLFIAEWLQREKVHPLQFDNIGWFRYKAARWSVYVALLLASMWSHDLQATFVYFQF